MIIQDPYNCEKVISRQLCKINVFIALFLGLSKVYVKNVYKLIKKKKKMINVLSVKDTSKEINSFIFIKPKFNYLEIKI